MVVPFFCIRKIKSDAAFSAFHSLFFQTQAIVVAVIALIARKVDPPLSNMFVF